MREARHRIYIFIFFFIGTLAKASEPIQLLTLKTHSRFVFQIDDGVPVEVKNSKDGFELFFKGIGLTELGALFGNENQWKEKYETLSDPRVETLRFSEVIGGVKLTGRWKFPSGDLTLAYPKMDLFDYRKKSPPLYTVDFWIHDGPTVIEVEATRRQKRVLALLKDVQKEEERRTLRKQALKKREKEIEHSKRFCDLPLSSKNNIFLEFYPIHQSPDFSKWLPVNRADTEFPYYSPKKKNRESQFVRLALNLVTKGSSALVIKTIDFFSAEFPKSDFQTEMKFLKANSLIKLGHHEAGERILKDLMSEARESPVALHSAMYLSGKLMQKKDVVSALENFMWLIQRYPEHQLSWVFHLGAAECLFMMKQTERAAKEYRWIMEHAPDESSKAEAVFRMGDLYLSRFQYEQALAQYAIALNYFKSQKEKFPEFHLNRGEALFQLGEYSRAKEVFENFLVSYPNHPGGWRASFRIGELSNINAKTKEEILASRNWYLNTANRYPYSPGATLSRIRLVPCGDHGGFDLKTSEKFFSEEASRFDGSDEVFMKNYSDFRGISHVQSLMNMGNSEQVTMQAVVELKTAKNGPLKKLLTTIANNYFGRMELELLLAGKKYKALSLYTQKSKIIPDPVNAYEAEYLLNLSMVASEFGFGKLADKLSEKYNKSFLLKDEEISETLTIKPGESESLDAEQQLKVSDQRFASAKALWVSSGQSLSLDDSKKIKMLLSQVREESKSSCQKEVILGLIDEKSGDLNSALKHFTRTKLLCQDPRIDLWIANAQWKRGDADSALQVYKNVEKRIHQLEQSKSSASALLESADLGGLIELKNLPTTEEIVLKQGEILESLGRWKDLSALYQRSIEEGIGESKLRFEYSRSLMKLGTLEDKFKAKKILIELSKSDAKSGEGKFWKSLASEILENRSIKQAINGNAKEGIW